MVHGGTRSATTYFGTPDENYVDENGMPIEPPPADEIQDPEPQPSEEDVGVPAQLDQKWLDGVLGRERR